MLAMKDRAAPKLLQNNIYCFPFLPLRPAKRMETRLGTDKNVKVHQAGVCIGIGREFIKSRSSTG